MKKDELWLENLDEFVNDENRIVTYKWLSRTLHIHCNIAKQMLYKFMQNERKKKNRLTVTYFVSGITKPDENGQQVLKCSVVSEDQLDAFKKSLAHLTSCHIFSVQKSKLKDSNALYTTDYEKFKENVFESNKYSSIQCERAMLRTQEELDLLTLSNLPAASDKKPADGVASSTTKPAGKKQPQSAIASMFSKAESKKPAAKAVEVKTAEPPKESKAATGKGDQGKKGGGMANFFSKQTEKQSEPKTEAATKQEDKPAEKKKPPVKPASPPSKSKKKPRKQDSDDEEIQNKSKRRRIKPDLFDSSDEEEEEMEEDEEPIPPTPPAKEPTPEPEDPVKENLPELEIITEATNKTSPAGESGAKGDYTGERRRKRVRKQVNKTYMGKDGFMVTEKVWESDSTDASEAEEPVKKAAKQPQKQAPAQTKGKKSPQKKPSPGKKGTTAASGKQTSLTSFFKKS